MTVPNSTQGLVPPSTKSLVVATSGQDLSTGQTIIAGAVAGLIELLIMFPLDVVKTRMQLVATDGLNTHKLSISGSLRSLVAEGGIPRLYRGILAPAIQEPIKRSCKFTGNQLYGQLFPYDNFASKFLAGTMAGMTECVAISPFEVVKVRMQAGNRLDSYRNTGHCARVILKQEGVMGFASGLETALWRSGSWSGVYFSTIWSLKRGPFRIDDERHADKTKIMARNFCCGFVGGTLGTIVNNPFDVVVSRMRNVVPGDVSPYRWSVQSLARIASEEGWRALYKGFGPKVLRLGPGGGIMIMAFDVMKDIMSSSSSSSRL